MVRFSVRSLAFMALSFVAAASPVAQGFNQPAAAASVAPAAANFAAPAPAMPAAVDNRNRDIAYQTAPNVAPQQVTDKPQARPEEQCVMVPCSEQECIKNMTPQELAEFRAQCETMKRQEIQKVGVDGKSRVSAAGGVDMTYYQMYTPQEAAQKGIHVDGKKVFLTTMNPNGQAVGNRPNGKNLCCCCCPCCCCCCPCCCCCCKCCCCKCCCCCCPCCCHCCC